jgi:acyl-CoA hydrolase
VNGDWPGGIVRSGDLVVVGQGVGEPTPLLEELLVKGPRDVEVFVGLSHSEALISDASLPLVSFGAMGPLSTYAATGSVAIIPCHFDDLPRALLHRAPGRLVVLMQVAPPDAQGSHSLGMAVDYTYELAGRARAVVAEINAQMPITSAPRLPASTFSAVVHTSRALPVVMTAPVRDVHRRIAAHVLPLVTDGATIQLGIGAVPSAIGAALTARHGLRVRSTLVGDWLLGLVRTGSLSREPGSVVISEAAGSAALYDYVATSTTRVCPVSDVVGPAAAGAVDAFVAINSALQVDLTGQVNAEEIGSGYIGAIGGQAEYLRAAQRSAGGRSIVVLPATTDGGRRSRIVHRLEAGTVTTPRSGVDVIVTEFGTADLRGRSLRERAELMTRVAAPQHREGLDEQDGRG